MRLIFGGRHSGKTAQNSLWDDLARETNLSQEYAKTCAYVLLYGGSIDPWLDSIVCAAMDKLAKVHVS